MQHSYALVNRPAGLGAVPRGLSFTLAPRPEPGQPHHDMARHGVLVAERELSDAECASFEFAPLVNETMLDAVAERVAAGMGRYAGEYVESAKADGAEFRAGVLDRAERHNGVRFSIGDPDALVSRVLALLEAMSAPKREVGSVAADIVFHGVRQRSTGLWLTLTKFAPGTDIPQYGVQARSWVADNEDQASCQAQLLGGEDHEAVAYRYQQV